MIGGSVESGSPLIRIESRAGLYTAEVYIWDYN